MHKKIISIFIFLLFAITNIYANEENLKIASFNVQVFGKSKISKIEVKETLIKIISRYDIIFIQEIRDNSEIAIKKLIDELNKSSNEKYNYIISERLGNSNSKEQYAFIYKIDKIKIVDAIQYAEYNDFERPPFGIKIEYKKSILALVGIHIDPDKVKKEIDNLNESISTFERKFSTKNIVIFGDMNAGCKYISPYELKYSNLKRNNDYIWLIDNDIDTTVSNTNCAYDRVIINKELSKNIESAQVFHFDQEFDLSQDDAKKVSDHYPVEFEITK